MRWSRAVGILCVIILAGCATPRPESPSDADLSEMLRKAAADAESAYDYAAASRHYGQLHDRKPDDVQALLGLARNLRYDGRPRGAVRLLKAAIARLGETAPLVLELGKAQLAAAIVGEAEATLERAVALAPEAWDAHASLGIVHDRLGRFAEAREEYHRALELSPGNASVANNLALSWAIDGEIDKAIEILAAVVTSENATPLARQNLALMYAIKGDLGRAERLARQDLPADVVTQNLEVLRESYTAAERPGPTARQTPETAAAPESPQRFPAESIRSLGW